DLDQQRTQVLVDALDHLYQLLVGVAAGEGVAEVFVSDRAVPAVDAEGQPGEAAGDGTRGLVGEGLDDADEHADDEVNGVVGGARAEFGHEATPLARGELPLLRTVRDCRA